MKITITDPASSHLQKMLQKGNQKYLHLGLVPGGCAGFKYTLRLSDAITDSDIVVNDNQIAVVVSPEHTAMLDGMTIDFLETLEGSGFKMHNPNFQRTCGCGQSAGN